MTINELRIGNFVIHNGEDRQICSVNISGHIGLMREGTTVGDGTYFENIKPIPLTEEWLLKFGFDKKPLVHWHGNDYDYQPKDSGTRQQDFVLNSPDENEFTVRFEEYYYKDKIDSCKYILNCEEWYKKVSEYKIYCSLEFVHDLQNIFYCLKKRELKII